MGSHSDPTTWTELAWPGKSAHYNALQHSDDTALCLNGIHHRHDVTQYDPASPAQVSAEGQQQQQQDMADELPDHGPFSSAAAVSDESEVPEGAVQRLSTQLTGLVWHNGHICMLLAAFIFSLSVLCVKLTGSRVPVLQITLVRSSMSFIVSAVLIKVRHITPMFGQRKHVAWLIGRGVTGALAMMTFYVAILKLPLADANTLFFLNPAMTALAAAVFLGEPLGLLGGGGCVLSLLGLVLLTHPPMLFGGHADWGPQRIFGTLFGVISAVGATGAFICISAISSSSATSSSVAQCCGLAAAAWCGDDVILWAVVVDTGVSVTGCGQSSRTELLTGSLGLHLWHLVIP
eukprot:GHUV01037445.1.p1 GENE.GHUV01037445.1~~GHUV01037445.1.p1  ORF type:complete len:347 (+),score=68.22 GHUV01037445.1:413-1453(+)